MKPDRPVATNSRDYAYTAEDINIVNDARNRECGYSRRNFIGRNASGQPYQAETSILEGELPPSTFSSIMGGRRRGILKDGEGRIVLQLPAVHGEGYPIGSNLKQEFHYLENLQKKGQEIYPLKILFPYKTDELLWNVGEIILSKEDDKVKIEGKAYNVFEGTGKLSVGIKEDILGFFLKYYEDEINLGSKSYIFDLDQEFTISTFRPTKTACGVYAAIALHNLKTKSADRIWDGVAGITEDSLRNADNVLVEMYCVDKAGSFCTSRNVHNSLSVSTFTAAAESKPEAKFSEEAAAKKEAKVLEETEVVLEETEVAEAKSKTHNDSSRAKSFSIINNRNFVCVGMKSTIKPATRYSTDESYDTMLMRKVYSKILSNPNLPENKRLTIVDIWADFTKPDREATIRRCIEEEVITEEEYDSMKYQLDTGIKVVSGTQKAVSQGLSPKDSEILTKITNFMIGRANEREIILAEQEGRESRGEMSVALLKEPRSDGIPVDIAALARELGIKGIESKKTVSHSQSQSKRAEDRKESGRYGKYF